MTTERDLIQRLADALEALQKEAVTTPHNQTIVVGGVAHPIPIGNDLLARDALHAHLLDRARAFLSQPEPEGLADEELLQIAAATIDPYESCGIAIGEYEAETECAVEVYGSELIAYARAVLARWGRAAVKPLAKPAHNTAQHSGQRP